MKPGFFEKFYFCFTGIAALIGWNSILTAFDFFGDKYPDYNVDFLMPLPQFFTSIITTAMMGKISKYMGINNRFYINYTILLFLFVAFPMVANFVSGATGFTIVMVLFGIVGSANSISQSSGYGLGSKMPMECVAWLTTGTGVSGIIINVVRMLCLVIFGSEGEDAVTNGAIAYFCVSGFILLCVIFMHAKFSRSKFFKY